MPDPNLIICPECSAHHHEDLIRCPACHAFLIDANPWNSQDGLRAALFSLIGTIGLIVFNGFVQTPLSIILADSISQAILLFGLFGVFLLTSRLRTIKEQCAAFAKIRQITCDNRPINSAVINEARVAVAGLGIASYNQALAFQRLRWLSAAASAPPSERQGVLEACRQHAEGDLDSVDNSFSRINFLVWLLPTAGFLGTVFGMTEALQSFARVVESGSDLSFNAGLTETARNLGVAFHTTLVGLAAVIPLLALATTVRTRTHTLLDAMNRYFLQLGSHLLYGIHEPKASDHHSEHSLINERSTSVDAYRNQKAVADASPRLVPNSSEPGQQQLNPTDSANSGPGLGEASATASPVPDQPESQSNGPSSWARPAEAPTPVASTEKTTSTLWPTTPDVDGNTPILPTLLQSDDTALQSQANYLMQAIGSLAKVGSFDPEQFQSVLKTTTGMVTIPAMVKTKDGASVLVYSWNATWNESAVSNLNNWLVSVRKLEGIDAKVPVLIITGQPWPDDVPKPDVLQVLHLDLSTDTPPSSEPASGTANEESATA